LVSVELLDQESGMTVLGLLLVLLLAFAPHAFALSNGQAANLVLGQGSFISNNTVATQTELDLPNAVAFDSSGNLWVADQNNNRVLEYKAPFSTHEAASLVIGQSSFTGNAATTSSTGLSGPTDLSFDSSGNLWVVDMGNSRVLEYTTPFATGEAATLVIGQSSFTSSDFADTNSTGLSYPTGLSFDSGGNLWVADQGNDRVLEYKTPFSTHEAASLVIGQSSFTSRECAFTSTCAASPTNLFDPNALSFDSSGNLWVADGDNNRVLEYAAPFSTHEAASLVIGQSSLTGSAAATSSTGLSAPEGLAFDSSGNLWVADYANSRVLQFGGSVTTTATTPEFPALAVPIIFTMVLAAAMLLLRPTRRFRQL
jgi:sugar lactone lactonase YvrE